MTRDIKRATLRDMARRYETDGFAPRSSANNAARRDHAAVRNNTSTALAAGTPVAIVGFASAMTAEQARSRSLNDSLVFNVRRAEATDAAEIVATLDEPLAAGAIGRATSSGIEFGTVDFSTLGTGSDYCDASFVGKESASPFRIVARTALDAASRSFCAVVRRGSSGGGGTAATKTFCSSVSVTTDKWLSFAFSEIEYLEP